MKATQGLKVDFSDDYFYFNFKILTPRALSIQRQNFRKFGNSDKWLRNFPEKSPEIPKAVEFPKCEPFNRIC